MGTETRHRLRGYLPITELRPFKAILQNTDVTHVDILKCLGSMTKRCFRNVGYPYLI